MSSELINELFIPTNKNFINSCKTGNINKIIWIQKQIPNDVDYKDAFEHACEIGNLEVAKWIMQVKPDDLTIEIDSELFLFSCDSGCLELAKWIYQQNPDIHINGYIFYIVCRNNYFDMARWIYSENSSVVNSPKYINASFEHSCKNGNIIMAKWLLSINKYINISPAFVSSCEKGLINIIEWLLSLNKFVDTELSFSKACCSGYRTIASIILNKPTNKKINVSFALMALCKIGNLEMIKWVLRLNGVIGKKINSNMVYNACEYGHLPLVDFFIKKTKKYVYISELFKDGYRIAYINGHYDIVKLITESKVMQIEYDMYSSAFHHSRSVETAKWLLKIYPEIQDCSDCWYSLLFNSCTKHYMEIIKWIFKNKSDVVIDQKILTSVFRKENIDIINYILLIRPDIDLSFNDDELFCNCCKNGNLEIANMLLKQNPNINISMRGEYPFKLACYSGHIEFAKWLISLNPEIKISDTVFNDMCILGNRLEIAEWIHSIRPNINIFSKTFRRACKDEYIDSVKWIHKLNPYRYTVVIKYNKIVSWHVEKMCGIKELRLDKLSDCPICYETECSNVVTNCEHMFCKTCIDKYNGDTCPYCRNDPVEFYLIKNEK